MRQPAGQHFQKSAIEVHAAGVGSPVQGGAGNGGDSGGRPDDDVGAARRLAADYRHFAEAVSWRQQIERTVLPVDAQFAFDEKTKEIAAFALAHDDGARPHVIPARKADDFPDFDIGEILEKSEAAQGLELFAVGDIAMFGKVTEQTMKSLYVEVKFSTESWGIIDESRGGLRLLRLAGPSSPPRA